MATSELTPPCERLIGECLDRETGPGRGELPVIVLLGPRGSGRTTILEEVAENAAASFSLPFLHFDCARQPEIRPWEMAAQVARRVMGDRWPQFSPVKLPRVVLGNLVLSLDPELGQEEAEQKLYELIRGRRGIPDNARTLQEIFDLLGGVLPMPPVGPVITGLIDRVARGRRLVELLERRAMDWYRDRLGPGGALGLVQLGETKEGFPLAGQIVCEALLEDLREGWSRGWRPRNCLLLLDDADTPCGRSFLWALTAARTHRAGLPEPPEHDPLLVVAASRSWPDVGSHWNLPGTPERLTAGGTRYPPRVQRAGHADWLTGRAPGPRGRWWYPVLLPDLSRAQVARMRERTRQRPGPGHAGFVHALTGGYPPAVERLLAAMADRERGWGVREENDGWTEQALRKLAALELEQPHGLFRDLDRDLDDLVTLSAAANLADAEEAGLLSRRWRSVSVSEALDRRMWLRTDPAQDMAPVLHPWLRRLLLRKLTRGRRGGKPSWDVAHECMESLYGSPREGPHDGLAMVMHHRLARVDAGPAGLRRLREVVTMLDGRFNRIDMAEWVRQYNWITSAPNRLPTGVPLDDLYGRLVLEPDEKRSDDSGGDRPRGTDRIAVVRGLVVDRWFLTDPVLDPLRGRRQGVQVKLRMLAQYAVTGGAVLVNEARRYDREDDDE
ncbi:hypothetical protein AB0D67_20580 [Streptosporangium sp. NPDC048047]|uniref:hypothetical protein n=1 Tax=Streptosporangium sp. NPDC048047 TaxID=3155748 RepID=UPI003417D316